MVDIHQQWRQSLIEWRHSPCLMRPISLIMLVIMLIFSLISLALTMPMWLIGILLAPLLSRGSWLIEFLYPLPIARWGHLLLLRWNAPKTNLEDKAAKYHSRTLEQRIEVVKGRVFVHPIPQLLDNLGYLVVCLPPPPPEPTTSTEALDATPLGKVSVHVQQQPDASSVPKSHIVAFLVDCGDAESVAEQVQLIREAHYSDYPSIRIQMILSSHKHHDHTAGNLAFKMQDKIGQHLEHIVGGAVEKVPGCNLPVADRDRLTLPNCGTNDMNEVVHVEVVAVPAHTRGSVVYLLRTNQDENEADNLRPCFAFTGDTLFSGGGGVPFEAGADADVDQGNYKDDAHGAIRPGVGCHAVERCFAEILFRGMSMPNTKAAPFDNLSASQDQFLIFPGHEYTTELLSRQFGGLAGGIVNDANKWKNFPPHVFFETVSQLYVSLHRRSLPQATGKILAAAPTTLRRELLINPHLRSLARRAELVVQAIRLWDAYFSKPKGPKDEEAALMRSRQQSNKNPSIHSYSKTFARQRQSSEKTKPTPHRWNMGVHDAAQSVFTTIYTTDLDAMIDDLASGKIDAEDAAFRLEELKSKISEPVIRRRPIPGTLPSERVVFKGLIGFALLGSRPSAMTLADSLAMKLPPPTVRDTSGILVSRKRLIAVLGQLGFLADSVDGQHLLSMIHSLWHECHEYVSVGRGSVTDSGANGPKYNAAAGQDSDGTTASQNDYDEPLSDGNDLVDLATLKWILYGFPAKQPTWFSKFCMSCSVSSTELSLLKRQDKTAQEEHPVQTSGMQRRHGELVRHDTLACRLCQSAAGFCSLAAEESEREYIKSPEMIHQKSSSSSSNGTDNGDPCSAKVALVDEENVVEESSNESVEITSLPYALREV